MSEADKEWGKFVAKQAGRGFKPVNSVDDILPVGHPLKGKPKPEVDKYWNSLMDGSSFEGGKQRPKSFGSAPDPREKYTHLIQPGSKQTYCGFEATDDQVGKWSEGTSKDLSANPCPACLKGRMNDGTETGCNQEVPD